VTSANERGDAKGARGNPLAGAIGAADPGSEVVELVVRIATVAHRPPSPSGPLGGAAQPVNAEIFKRGREFLLISNRYFK
jgi:hypothetical protein